MIKEQETERERGVSDQLCSQKEKKKERKEEAITGQNTVPPKSGA